LSFFASLPLLSLNTCGSRHLRLSPTRMGRLVVVSLSFLLRPNPDTSLSTRSPSSMRLSHPFPPTWPKTPPLLAPPRRTAMASPPSLDSLHTVDNCCMLHRLFVVVPRPSLLSMPPPQGNVPSPSSPPQPCVAAALCRGCLMPVDLLQQEMGERARLALLAL